MTTTTTTAAPASATATATATIAAVRSTAGARKRRARKLVLAMLAAAAAAAAVPTPATAKRASLRTPAPAASPPAKSPPAPAAAPAPTTTVPPRAPAAVVAPRATDPSTLAGAAPDSHATVDGKSDCGACHSEIRWSDVRFDHDRTDFSLSGAHAETSCRSCHRHDFRARVPDTCSGCHRDRHAGALGSHCEGCHDETDWHAVSFWANGHRDTRFPLIGKHGAIPCQECHGNLRDRAFSPTQVACVACHRADFDSAALKSIDHVAARFGTDCQSCHSTISFFPARFDAHDLCFTISTGSHRGMRCTQCHSSTAGLMLTGACNTQTTTCTSCHTHDCSRADPQHANVMGYACVNQKCDQCHQTLR